MINIRLTYHAMDRARRRLKWSREKLYHKAAVAYQSGRFINHAHDSPSYVVQHCGVRFVFTLPCADEGHVRLVTVYRRGDRERFQGDYPIEAPGRGAAL